MKIFFTVVLFCISIAAFPQSVPTFCLSLGGGGFDRNLCGTKTYDGNYVAGGIVGIGADQNNFLAKCDGEGNILWSHELGSNFVDDFYGMIETSDHYIVVVGFQNGKMCMVKYDNDGNEIWKKDIVVQTFDYLYDIIETSDGNYLLTGVAEDLLHGWYYTAVIKVTTDGDLLWNKNLYGTYHSENAYTCTETADHRYVIGGYSAVFSDQFYLISMDESGTVQWVKKSVDGGVAYDLIPSGDSSVVVAGYICKSSGCNPMLTKVDASGNIEWSYTYGDSLFGRFYSIAKLPDGSFAMGGDATDQFTIYHGFIVRCDSNGQMLWGKTTGGTEYRSIAGSNDGGIIASATLGLGFGIVKMDADGNLCPECLSADYGIQDAGTTFSDWSLSEFSATATISASSMTEVNLTPTVTIYCNDVGINETQESNSFSIFPNPADVRAAINFQSSYFGKKTLRVFDAVGREILNSEIRDPASESINVSSWPNGIYFCNVYSQNKIEVSKFIVQH